MFVLLLLKQPGESFDEEWEPYATSENQLFKKPLAAWFVTRRPALIQGWREQYQARSVFQPIAVDSDEEKAVAAGFKKSLLNDSDQIQKWDITYVHGYHAS